ncbi:nucleotide-binding domain-containing protein [Trametes elegans]|nr:nucleotide-binding domain-containing protein [Trametes elegans]
MPTTVILGGGIIGLSTAHSLSELAPPDHRVHLVEPAPELFSSASGKAAGFLAKDWFAPALAPLGNLSFDLHRALADKHNGRARWAYSESISYSLDHTEHDDHPDARADGVPAPAHPISDDPQQDGASDRANVVDPERDLTSTDALPSTSTEDVAVSGRNGSQGQGGLDWLLNNTSRATVVEADTVEKAHSETDEGGEWPKWLRAKPDALQVISDKKSTAQVHPRQLCEFLLEQCLAAGVTLHHPARASNIWRDEPGGVTRIRVEYLGPQSKTSDGRARTVDVPCDNVVIAAGCWTPQVYATLFPNASRMPRVTHLAGYSVTFTSKHWPPVRVPTDPHALRAPSDPAQGQSSRAPAAGPASPTTVPAFLGSSYSHAIFTDAGGFAPEIFSRATGDVWLGGLNPATAPLPALPTEAAVEQAEVERLLAVAHALCGADIELRGAALCFRPVSATGRPIIARMHEADLGDGVKPRGHDGAGGVYVATGHGPWGISLSLGTGRVVSEMVLGRETSADIGALTKW